ncbi:MAG: MBL fold metallo-hydrolase [Nitriliruptoraceae bacterium]
MGAVRSAVAALAALSMLLAGCGEASSNSEPAVSTTGEEPGSVEERAGDAVADEGQGSAAEQDDRDEGRAAEQDEEPAADPDEGRAAEEDQGPPAAGETGPGDAPPVEGTLEVHYIDVGQANATLLHHDAATMLIDQGDWRRDEVAPYLRAVGIDELDVVVTTHPHADHIGQFPAVLDTFPVAEVWWSGAVTTSQTFQRALDALDTSDAAYAEPRAGDTTDVGPLEVEFVAPTDTEARSDNLNDTSLAARITYGEVRFLFTGDAEAGVEARMARDHADQLDAEVYLAGHHGSATSTTTAFLETVDPAIAVYAAGAGNSFGHPDAAVLDRLAARGTEVYGTDINGTVVVTTDGTSIEVGVERDGRPAPGGSGDPDGAEPDTGDDPAGADAAPPSESESDGCSPDQVDVNTATIDELQRIIHIGPARAEAIVSDRPFESVESLTRLDGIGPARIADIISQGVACAS